MLEVEPGAERRARALQHHDTGRAVALQSFEIGIERVDQRGIERVEAVRAIERDPIDAVMMCDQQWLGHANLQHASQPSDLYPPLEGEGRSRVARAGRGDGLSASNSARV